MTVSPLTTLLSSPVTIFRCHPTCATPMASCMRDSHGHLPLLPRCGPNELRRAPRVWPGYSRPRAAMTTAPKPTRRRERSIAPLSQSVEMGADDGIALARCGLKPLAVPHRDPPMRVADESSLLQRGGNDTHGWTLHTEH